MNENAASWDDVAGRLAEAVASLADGQSVLVDAGADLARPFRRRTSRLRRTLLGGTYEQVSPWIRLARLEDHVRATCVRLGEHDDGFPMSPDEMAGVLALGWHEPGPADGPDFVRFWPDDVPQGPYLPSRDREAAVDGALAVLREVFGARPDQIRIVLDPG